ncbi:hypothetical protein [Actinophytocola sp.]|uniref:hypothetical protein n=1 Tax=Actinophytocola sp. TaxID=1872138 RepID=UPI002D5BD916|nr:hypothetical protein [Actinophytocola sp.]HYQ62698.1 hypothetical protein [Actinophytocola sp.]
MATLRSGYEQPPLKSLLICLGFVAVVLLLDGAMIWLNRVAEHEAERQNVGTRLSPRGADTRAADEAARAGVENIVSITEPSEMPKVSDALDPDRAGAAPGESPAPAPSAGATSPPQDGDAPAEAREGGLG